MTTVDPLSVRCSYCNVPAGERCLAVATRPPFLCYWTSRSHAARVRLALAAAAHADPALDAFSSLGPVSPCGLCGSGLPQRHRIVDAIAERLAAGEGPEELAADYLVSVDAVLAVQIWAAKWGMP